MRAVPSPREGQSGTPRAAAVADGIDRRRERREAAPLDRGPARLGERIARDGPVRVHARRRRDGAVVPARAV